MNPQPSLEHTPSSRRTGGRGKGCQKLKTEAWKAFYPIRESVFSVLFFEEAWKATRDRIMRFSNTWEEKTPGCRIISYWFLKKIIFPVKIFCRAFFQWKALWKPVRPFPGERKLVASFLWDKFLGKEFVGHSFPEWILRMPVRQQSQGKEIFHGVFKDPVSRA